MRVDAEQHSTARAIKFLAYYQIAGGILGIFLWIWLVAPIKNISGIYLLIILSMLFLEGFSIYCGRLILKNAAQGLQVSTINQALQIISFAVSSYGFKYVAGIGFFIGIDLTSALKVSFNFSLSNFQMTLNQDPDLITLGFNAVAIYLLFLCTRLKVQLGRPTEELPLSN